jgi:CheY-like chemotaxis protein
MSINRVLDFTKVNEKKKLVPNYETVHLDEVLHFPVECMSNIQERIEIQLQPIAAEICSHVITDKQWLQENILCLLSNAVKYSSEGPVTVSVHLIKSYSQKHDVTTRCSSPVVSRPPAIHIPVIQTNSVIPFSNAPPILSSPSATVRLSFKTSAFFPNQTIYRNNSDSFHRETDRTVDNNNNNNNISSPVPGESQMFLLFEVEDHGIGMSEEARANLFSPFQQAQSLAGGTGLGLFSLSKRIEALKGTYGVKSRKDGTKGSLFWFTIPYRPDEITASTKDPENPVPDVTVSGSGSAISILKSVRFLRNSFYVRPLELLLVDDSPSILKMASMMLKRQGHSITVAENGEIALKKVEERWKTVHKGFDVILMDLQMPIMDGLEATKRLRKMEKGKCDWMKELSSNKTENLNEVVPDNNERVHQLIFGTSANYDDSTQQAAYEAGVDGFLDKPFTLDSLLALLHEHNTVTMRNH